MRYSNVSTEGEELKAVPFHEALARPVLLFGAERPVAILSVAVPVYLMFILSVRFGLFIGIPVGATLLTVGLAIGNWMAKRDPQFTSVFRRALRYRGYYPATSRPDVAEPAWRSSLRQKR